MWDDDKWSDKREHKAFAASHLTVLSFLTPTVDYFFFKSQMGKTDSIVQHVSVCVCVCVSDWVSKRLHSGCVFMFSTARTTYCTSSLLDFMFMKGEAGLDILHLALSDQNI